MKEGAMKEGVRVFEEAERFAALASTREDLAGVEEAYWIAFNMLNGSPDEGHRSICARCLEAVARILNGEGRPAAAEDLRRQAETYRKPAGSDTVMVSRD